MPLIGHDVIEPMRLVHHSDAVAREGSLADHLAIIGAESGFVTSVSCGPPAPVKRQFALAGPT